jgi:regulator of replication initiation timing
MGKKGWRMMDYNEAMELIIAITAETVDKLDRDKAMLGQYRIQHAELTVENNKLRGENIRLRETLAELTVENYMLRQAVAAVGGLIDESEGVYGLHLNGDEAPWDELLPGGRFEGWLCSFSEALHLMSKSQENNDEQPRY